MNTGLQKSALLLARTGLLCSLVACGMEPWESMPYKSELKVAQLSDGTEVRYSVAEPPLLDAEDPPTIVIAMPLGLETYRNASLTISEIWQPIAQSRGWVIVSPAEPNERFFWQDKWLYGKGAETHFPGFLEHLEKTYNVGNPNFHMVEIGHDGDGAVACVLTETDKFSSVTLVPHFGPEGDRMRLLGQKPNIRTTILISDQVRYWSRDDSILPFDVPGVAIKKIPIPGLLSEEGIGPVLASLPFICLEIETAIHPREEE